MESLPTEGEWAVVHCMARCEKKIETFCRAEEIGVFLPVITSEKRYEGRVRVHTRPMFPGYVFVRGGDNQLKQVQQHQRCANLIRVENQAELESQLVAVHQAMTQGLTLEVVPYIQAGKKVRLLSGPFKGTIGIVQEIRGQHHIILSFDLIQQSVAMQVDVSMLGPVG